ncbi:NAD-dependent epimerase/dehydratase family protein [Gammaproteobacteria bacterium]|nr:NAD-dependent epimerase/dehydratase family protein [Gammaproteobacteria bacterium]
MNILVTGASGFLGFNLIERIQRNPIINILKFNRQDSEDTLEEYIKNADFIFHLAGTNKGSDEDLYIGNEKFTRNLCNFYNKFEKKVPIIFASTRHVETNNAYGSSKLNAENILKDEINDEYLRIYRLSNLFGKWCKPNYNSVVATFCHNITRGIDIKINNPLHQIPLVYIDDVTKEFEYQILNKDKFESPKDISPNHVISIQELAEIIYSFKNMRSNIEFEGLGNGFKKKLYSTYLTYLPQSNFSYALKTHSDERGIFSEFMRLGDHGQISFFTAKPGVSRGKHYHDTKTEKFLVVSGIAEFIHHCRNSKEEYKEIIKDKDYRVVDTIPGWVHEIKNIGNKDLVIMAWANECFDNSNPDTHGVN